MQNADSEWMTQFNVRNRFTAIAIVWECSQTKLVQRNRLKLHCSFTSQKMPVIIIINWCAIVQCKRGDAADTPYNRHPHSSVYYPYGVALLFWFYFKLHLVWHDTMWHISTKVVLYICYVCECVWEKLKASIFYIWLKIETHEFIMRSLFSRICGTDYGLE